MPLWTILLSLAVLACALVTVTVWQTVLQLGAPELRLERFARFDHPGAWEIAEEIAPWAVRHGLEFLGGFRLLLQSEPMIFAWRSTATSEFFCQYQQGGQLQYDIVSIFGPRLGMTTTSTKDTFTLPQPPGVCVQAFPGQDLDGLWNRHVASREAFVRVFGEPQYRGEEFESLVLGSLRRQAEYVRSLPFWQFRGPWWFFVGRDRKKNRLASEVYDLTLLARTLGSATPDLLVDDGGAGREAIRAEPRAGQRLRVSASGSTADLRSAKRRSRRWLSLCRTSSTCYSAGIAHRHRVGIRTGCFGPSALRPFEPPPGDSALGAARR